MAKTWFITGSSRGFGRTWARAALERGDRVAAACRDVGSMAPLNTQFGTAVLPVTLDVTDRLAVFGAVARAHDHFGRLDVVVNNAGYGHFGFIEDVTEADARAQLETNLFGALWVTQAAIPLLRAQGGGHLLQISSIGGVAAYPGLGLYCASKWALEGLSEALAQEVAPFGIDVTIVEPGGYATDWAGTSARFSEPSPAYRDLDESTEAETFATAPPPPEATVAAILAAVDADEPPLRLLLTGGAYDEAQLLYDDRKATWAKWETVTRSAS